MKNSEGINFIILAICPLNKFHVPKKKNNNNNNNMWQTKS